TDHRRGQGTSSVAERARPARPETKGPGAGSRPNRPQDPPPDRSPVPPKAPGTRTRRGWILGAAAAIIAVGILGRIGITHFVGTRLRSRPAASLPPTVGGIPLAPEEASLQRQAEQN